MQRNHAKSYSYNHLETDEEVIERLKKDGVYKRVRHKFSDEDFDTWLEGSRIWFGSDKTNADKFVRKLVHIIPQ